MQADPYTIGGDWLFDASDRVIAGSANVTFAGDRAGDSTLSIVHGAGTTTFGTVEGWMEDYEASLYIEQPRGSPWYAAGADGNLLQSIVFESDADSVAADVQCPWTLTLIREVLASSM